MRHYQLAYAGLYDMGMEARRLKNLRSVNGTVILMDGTLHMHHNPSHNANLMESETVNFIFLIFHFFWDILYGKYLFQTFFREIDVISICIIGWSNLAFSKKFGHDYSSYAGCW